MELGEFDWESGEEKRSVSADASPLKTALLGILWVIDCNIIGLHTTLVIIIHA